MKELTFLFKGGMISECYKDIFKSLGPEILGMFWKTPVVQKISILY